MIGRLKALKGLVQTSRQGGDVQLGNLALRAAADFCLDPENFGRFSGWAACRPPDSPYAWSDAETLRKDVEAGRAMLEAAEQLMPLVMGQLQKAAKEGPE